MILLILALAGPFDIPVPAGMVRYGDTFFPVGTLERIRTFNSTDKKTNVEAIFQKLNPDGSASLWRIKDRIVVNVPLKAMSAADRKWVNDLAAKDKKLKRSPWKPE